MTNLKLPTPLTAAEVAQLQTKLDVTAQESDGMFAVSFNDLAALRFAANLVARWRNPHPTVDQVFPRPEAP